MAEKDHKRGSVLKEWIIDQIVSKWFWPKVFEKIRGVKNQQGEPIGENLWMDLNWHIREHEGDVNIALGATFSVFEWLKDFFSKLPVAIHDITDEIMGQSPRGIIAYFTRAEIQKQIPDGYEPKIKNLEELGESFSSLLKIHLPQWRGELLRSIPERLEKVWRNFTLSVIDVTEPTIDALQAWVTRKREELRLREAQLPSRR